MHLHSSSSTLTFLHHLHQYYTFICHHIPWIIHLDPSLSTFIRLRAPSSTVIHHHSCFHLHQPSYLFIHPLHITPLPPLYTLIHRHTPSNTFIDIHLPSYLLIHLYPFLSTIIHLHQLSSSFIQHLHHRRPPLSMLINLHQYLSTFIYRHTASMGSISKWATSYQNTLILADTTYF